MTRRFVLVLLGLAACVVVQVIHANGAGQDKQNKNSPLITGKDGQPGINTAKLSAVEKDLGEKYSAFEKLLLTLHQRLANSDEKDKLRAAQLKKVLDTSSERNVGLQMGEFWKFLSNHKFDSTLEIDALVVKSMVLAKDLRDILDLLRNDNGAGSKKEERLAIEALIKALGGIIRDQKLVRSQIPTNPDKEAIAKDQNEVVDKTANLERKLGGKGDGKPKDTKSTAKAAGKGNLDKADGKDKGKPGEDAKAGDAKKPGKDGGDAKEPGKKDGDDKENKPKSGPPADAGKAADAKGDKAPKVASASKSGGDSSPKQGESKPGSDSKSQGAAKSNGQPSDQPPPDPAAGKSDNQDAPKDAAPPPKDSIANAKKRIQEAEEHMKRVTDEIAKGKRDPAGKEADEAVEKLEAARRKLEELLRQLREEELDRVLAALIQRCQKMLAMQEEVLRGTLVVQAQVETSPNSKPGRESILASLNLSDDEIKIVDEASKAIEILETEGSAVAFPEVFHQVREDMKHVHRRLKSADVGDVTITIEQDIIDTLREMVKALEKAKKDVEGKKTPKQGDSPPTQAQDQKLIDKIAELKMIRSMQLRVNSRTELYSKRYEGREQAIDEDIRIELRDLAGRQDRIFEVTTKMAKGDGQ